MTIRVAEKGWVKIRAFRVKPMPAKVYGADDAEHFMKGNKCGVYARLSLLLSGCWGKRTHTHISDPTCYMNKVLRCGSFWNMEGARLLEKTKEKNSSQGNVMVLCRGLFSLICAMCWSK